jgi:mono/diheme cytochrome c family protein
MKNPKKLILQILISTSVILFLLVGLFIFVIKKNGITEFDRKSSEYQPKVVKTEKTTPEFERGKEIYTSNCNVCHKRRSIINTFSMTNGIMNEMGIDYFKEYITKQDSLTSAKDIYATRIKDDYGNLGNSHNFKYSDSELNDLIEYIKTEK